MIIFKVSIICATPGISDKLRNVNTILRTFIVDKSWRQIFFKPLELTILVVNISISRKKNMLTVVTRGSFLNGLDNKTIGFVHI